MTVSTWRQPNHTDPVYGLGNAYKTTIDGAAHVHHRIGGAFACHQQDGNSPDAPDMTVVVDAGALVRAGLVPLEVDRQSTGALTAPVSNPRHDVVYIDNATGEVGVVTGSEAGSPSDPAIPAGKTAVARISLFVGMTEVTNADIDDLRVGGSAPEFTGPDLDASPQTNGTSGIVPGPVVADAGKYLRTDGWAAIADQTARDMAASAMALADANGIAGPVGSFLLADPFTSDTLAVKTNASYDSTNDWYSNQPATSYANTDGQGNRTGTITVSASIAPNGGTNDNLVDGGTASNTSDGWGEPIASVGINNGMYFRFQFGTSRYIDEVRLRKSSATSLGAWKIQGSNDASTWTDLASFTWNSADLTLALSNIPITGFTYYQVVKNGAGTNWSNGYITEVDFKIAAAGGNMTLKPSPAALSVADPADVIAYFLVYPVSAVTYNTDLVGKVSIDGGSAYETGTLTKVGTFGNYDLLRLDVDLSMQSGSSLLYSLESANLKAMRFKQAVGIVPLY